MIMVGTHNKKLHGMEAIENHMTGDTETIGPLKVTVEVGGVSDQGREMIIQHNMG